MIYTPKKGESFFDAIKRLQANLKTSGSTFCQMLFNDVYICITVDSNVDDLATIYDLKQKIRKYETTYGKL